MTGENSQPIKFSSEWYNQEFNGLIGHLSVGVAMNQKGSMKAVKRARYYEGIKCREYARKDFAHRLFGLAHRADISSNTIAFEDFQRSVNVEISLGLLREPVGRWVEPKALSYQAIRSRLLNLRKAK